MNLLISTIQHDIQAIIVKLALESLQHQVSLWLIDDWPNMQSEIIEQHYDVIWQRQPPPVSHQQFPACNLAHTIDFKTKNQLLSHSSIREPVSIYENISRHVSQPWWINDPIAANRTYFKLLQLKIASECHMTIPTTLCSNDPEEIHSFIKNSPHAVISKLLWDSSVKTNTPLLTVSNLFLNPTLQQPPKLFQSIAVAEYELRIIAFGDYLVAVKLRTQSNQMNKIAEPYILPTLLTERIKTFMRRIGIAFGLFDFIVTPWQEYIFIEVHEQGSFLWLEMSNPELPLLDIFIQFLLNQSVQFIWQPAQKRHTLATYSNMMNKSDKEGLTIT